MRALAVLTLAATVSQGYYHFLQYANRDGRLTALPTKFDLNVLPTKTVSYFIAEGGPDKFASGDSMTALASQIRLAAKQWNDVETSDLRLQFGGFGQRGDTSGTSGIDIFFGEIPPGLIAMGGPTPPPAVGPGATFAAIQRSVLILPKDMSALPSSTESTFLTLVHEFGHTLGLQHSLTSSAMATEPTRVQSKGRALGPDDIAGISLLYPTRAFQSSLGAISGRVTVSDSAAPLASVVAISASGVAIGTLANPNGTYRIDGLPPGQYYVYTHSLPPALSAESAPANIQLPVGTNGAPIQPAPAFDLEFYPGVRQQVEATSIPVTAGGAVEGINFVVNARRTPLRIFNVLAYSFPGQIAVRGAYVNVNGPRNFFVANGTGLISGGQPVTGLQASLVGATTQISSIRTYPQSSDYLQFNLGFTEESGTGPRHVIFSTGTDVYVQPAAITLTSAQPPQIESVAAGENRSMVLTGAGLSSQTRIFFDGAPAAIRSFDSETGRLTVSPPPGPGSHRAVLTALNPDGQSSLFLQGDSPATSFLEGSDSGSVTLSPSTLPAGAESAIEISGTNTNFVDGLVTVGFGSPEITARRVWVLSPTRLLVQVRVSANAPNTPVNVTVTNGLHSYSASAGFAAGLADSRRMVIGSMNANPLTGIISASAGNLIVLTIGSAAPIAQPPQVTIADRPAAVTALAPSVYSVQVPAELPVGPAILRVQANGESALPQAIQIEGPVLQVSVSPSLRSSTSDGPIVSQAGDNVVLQLSSAVEPPNPFHKPRVTVMLGGVEHLARLTSQTSVTFTVLPSVASGNQSLTVTIDGRVSASTTLTISQQ